VKTARKKKLKSLKTDNSPVVQLWLLNVQVDDVGNVGDNHFTFQVSTTSGSTVPESLRKVWVSLPFSRVVFRSEVTLVWMEDVGVPASTVPQ
jgi:hypothetical protein